MLPQLRFLSFQDSAERFFPAQLIQIDQPRLREMLAQLLQTQLRSGFFQETERDRPVSVSTGAFQHRKQRRILSGIAHCLSAAQSESEQENQRCH